jgi:DNA polymerase V
MDLCLPSRHGAYALRGGSLAYEFEIPTFDTTRLLKVAEELLETLYDKEVPYKKAGVIVSGLIPRRYVAPSLFGPLSKEHREDTVYDVVDRLNTRFGRGTVRPGVVHKEKTWAPLSQAKSGEYTTQWEDIAVVYAK